VIESDAHTEPSPASSGAKTLRANRGLAPGPFAPLAHALLLGGAAAAVFLAAGVPQGSAGIFLVCAGAALVFCPPGAKVDSRLWLAAGALLLCTSLAFLPAHWFPVPAWRAALESMPVVPLPATMTPVPWQSAFWLALLACTALIGLFLLAQPVRSSALLSLALAAASICGAYAALAIYAQTTGWHYPFAGGASFGFFPNRNHTATFLITGSILGLGILGVTLRAGRYLAGGLAAACLTVCVSGLFFYSGSRGGIVFLLLGTLLWIIGLGRTHRHTPLLVSLGTLLLAAGILFALSGSEVRNRIVASFEQERPAAAASASLEPVDGPASHPRPGAGEDTPFDFRVLIYRDTLDLIRDFPVTGTGLGAFALVFPQYRNASLTAAPAAHPESDWLMLVAEAGVPALLCVLVLLWLLGGRLSPLTGHPYWPLRWGCVAAAGAAVLHGLVDVPAHHVSLGWWILAVGGLGLQPGSSRPLSRSRTQHVVFVLGGAAMLILGVQLIRAEWFGAAPLPPFVSEHAQAQIVQAYAQRDFGRAARMARQAIFTSPLEETFYHEWGALELPFADSDAQVDAAFRAERLLNPGAPAVPLRQGEAWLRYDNARAVTLWLDALSRQERLDRMAGLGQKAGISFFQDLVGRAAKWPDVQQGLLAAVVSRPGFVLVWLESARPALVREQLERFSRDSAFLGQLDAGEQRRFLLAWYTRGDRAKLAQFIDGHPGWQEVAWPVRLQQWIDAQEFERAVQGAAQHYQISLALPAPSLDGSPGAAPPEEPADPVAAFSAYWRIGNSVAAARVLEQATGNGAHPVPPEIWRLNAAVAAQKSNWAAAWQSLRQYIRAERADGPL
jgi:O-antigen ligase